MKRGLIALAIAGAFAAPAAMADVTISGAVNMGLLLGDASDGTGAPGTGFSNNSLHPTYSHFDLESTDDIGNGNKVIFHYQFDISGTSSANPASARGSLGNRNSFLGVAGTWGAFKYGVNENVYERFMYQADPLDGAAGPGGNLLILGTASSAGGASTIFEVGQAGCASGASHALSNGNPGCMGFYRRAEQEIWYESPNWNGFTFEVDYTLSAFKTAGGTDPKLLSIGGKWQPEGMPFYVDVAIEQHDDMFGVSAITGTPLGSGSSDDALQIGGGYTFGELTLHLRYEQLTYEQDGVATGAAITNVNQWERNAYWFGAKYNLASGYVAGAIGIAEEGECTLSGGGACNFGTDTGATLLGLGYFHNLSKQSQLQFIYNQIDNDPNAAYVAFGTFSNLSGMDHKGVYVGMKHTF
jgi:predicted porin